MGARGSRREREATRSSAQTDKDAPLDTPPVPRRTRSVVETRLTARNQARLSFSLFVSRYLIFRDKFCFCRAKLPHAGSPHLGRTPIGIADPVRIKGSSHVFSHDGRADLHLLTHEPRGQGSWPHGPTVVCAVPGRVAAPSPLNIRISYEQTGDCLFSR